MPGITGMATNRTATMEQTMHRIYPEQINLPFNRSELPEGFQILPCPGSAGVSQTGHRVLISGQSVLMVKGADGVSLPDENCLPDPECMLDPVHFADWNGAPVIASSISTDRPIPERLIAESFNAFNDSISPPLLSITGMGKQILHWDRSSRFCPVCGAAMIWIGNSWGKLCTGCSREQFPGIHPCAIVVVKRDDQLLLIRKPEWPKGRYSLVAGFLDFAESLEECAAREVKEETGVTVRHIRYVTSQSWPFPSQLMAGFVAEYSHGDIAITDPEIEDARWFTIGSLPSLPASRSIARFMIDLFNKV